MAAKFVGCAQAYLSKLMALQKPVVYNTKVAIEVAKQVYVKEGMAFPTGAQFTQAQQTLQNSLKISNLKNLSFQMLPRVLLFSPKFIPSSSLVKLLVAETYWLQCQV
ncbi:unnamed protein product [Mucor hiemalis]